MHAGVQTLRDILQCNRRLKHTPKEVPERHWEQVTPCLEDVLLYLVAARPPTMGFWVLSTTKVVMVTMTMELNAYKAACSLFMLLKLQQQH